MVANETSSWPERFIETNDIRLCIHRTGGDKQPVVLLHGITDNGLCWSRVARALEGEFDVIMVDARGHGKSAVDRSDFSFGLMAEDVAGLIRALDLRSPPILGGHSMGGQVATLVAAEHPELVSRVFLEDPAYFMRGSLRFLVKLVLPFMMREWRKNGRRDAAEIERSCRKRNPAWVDEEVVPWVAAQQDFGRNMLDGRLGKVDLFVDWHPVFQKVKCPSLLIIPSKGIMSLEKAKEIRPLFGDARVEYIPGAGHSVRREQYEKYMAAVQAFCRAA
ncbi:MAG: alpha/beta hydrolase [Candidatus Lokiarchaeota archaeon]|nr:alpha/beta hydrolase [Candidatus Lokiarchaeota archaeon]